MNPTSPQSGTIGPVVLGSAMAGALLLVRVLSPGVPDTGDGVAHYQVARYAFAHPELLLDAWGKPLFTLMAAPFAQLGMWGVVLMNALLIAGAACIMSGQVGRVASTWAWAVPVMLCSAPQLCHTSMAGLTEPLFAVLAVCAVILVLRERWSVALGVASFLPFARPEHVVVLPVILLMALWQKQWRALPWALLGTVFYTLLATIITGDPREAFPRDPYRGVDIYGSGPAMHFVEHMREVIGTPLIVATLMALAVWPWLWFTDREQRRDHARVLLLAFVPAFGVLLIHSYAWWAGDQGSLGLLRVLATGVPLLVLFNLHTLASAWRRWPWPRARQVLFIAGLITFSAFAFPQVVDVLALPYEPDGIQLTERKAAAEVERLRAPGQRLFYLTPYIGALCDVDPMDSTQARLTFGARSFHGKNAPWPGDLFLWDAHHSRVDGGITRDTIMNDRGFTLLASFRPEVETRVIGDVPYEALLFRYTPSERTMVTDTLFTWGNIPHGLSVERIDTVASEAGRLTVGDGEYPISFNALELGNDPASVEERLIVSGSVIGPPPAGNLHLVYTEERRGEQVRYDARALVEGPFEEAWMIGPGSASSMRKLYLWNRTGVPVGFGQLRIMRERTTQRSLAAQ